MDRTFVLENERLKAEIYSERGANIIRLYDKKYNAEILRKPTKLSDFETDNPYLYGMPLLFPPNRISGAEFEFEKRKYHFPINEAKTGCFVHGVMHKMPFVVSSADEESIRLEYEATDNNPYLSFPHTFLCITEYKIKDNRLLHNISITNTSKQNMPLGLGFHTTFNISCSGKNYIRANVKKEFFRDSSYLPTGEYDVDTELIKRLNSHDGYVLNENGISAVFEMGEGNTVSIRNEDITVSYELDEKYRYLMLYGIGKDFICIEPQTWLSNCPNMKDREELGFDYIKPFETKSFRSCIMCEATSLKG